MRWITREHIKVDRSACPWLIRKFIDPTRLLHGIFRFDCHTGTEVIHDEKHPSTFCDFVSD